MELFKAVNGIDSWWEIAAVCILAVAWVLREVLPALVRRTNGSRKLSVTEAKLMIAEHCEECRNVAALRADLAQWREELSKHVVAVDDKLDRLLEWYLTGKPSM